MTNKQYALCVSEASEYADRDVYISDLALSTIWDDDPESEIPVERMAQLSSIYDAVHRSVPEIAAAAGISNRKLADRFCIPYRTVENWCGGQRNCPDYIRLMMQECLGLLKGGIANESL